MADEPLELSPVDTLRVIRLILGDAKLTLAERATTIGVVLCAAGDTGLAWASYRSLQREFHLSSDAVANALRFPAGEQPGGKALGRYLSVAGRGLHGSVSYEVLPPGDCGLRSVQPSAEALRSVQPSAEPAQTSAPIRATSAPVLPVQRSARPVHTYPSKLAPVKLAPLARARELDVENPGRPLNPTNGKRPRRNYGNAEQANGWRTSWPSFGRANWVRVGERPSATRLICGRLT